MDQAKPYVFDRLVYPYDLSGKVLYMYFDESGDLDFSVTGSKYFILTCMIATRPFKCADALRELKHSLIEDGFPIESFHACDDRKWLRPKIFDVIESHANEFATCYALCQKDAAPAFTKSAGELYCNLFEDIASTVLDRFKLDALSSIVAITDRLPNEVRKKNYEHQMRLMLSKRLKARFTIAHHRSCSDMNLQVADYLSWAIQRKMEHDDAHWFRRIERTMLSSIEYHEISI